MEVWPGSPQRRSWIGKDRVTSWGRSCDTCDCRKMLADPKYQKSLEEEWNADPLKVHRGTALNPPIRAWSDLHQRQCSTFLPLQVPCSSWFPRSVGCQSASVAIFSDSPDELATAKFLPSPWRKFWGPESRLGPPHSAPPASYFLNLLITSLRPQQLNQIPGPRHLAHFSRPPPLTVSNQAQRSVNGSLSARQLHPAAASSASNDIRILKRARKITPPSKESLVALRKKNNVGTATPTIILTS